jgi:tetratricopeptide (TPR) repeat protein
MRPEAQENEGGSAMRHDNPTWKLVKRACLRSILGIALLLTGTVGRADDFKDHFDKAIGFYKQKKNAEALDEFEQARKIRQADPLILNWIGFIYLQDQKYPEALDPLEKAVKVKPNFAEAHLNLGNVYDGLKRYPDAIREFEAVARLQASTTDPAKVADPYFNMGSVYVKMGRLPDALAAYQRAATLNPRDAYIQDGLNIAQQEAGNYDAAVKAGDKATKLMPENANFWLNLALADMGQAHTAQASGTPASRAAADTAFGNARMALDHAAKLSPSDYQIRETWGSLLYEMGRDADAVSQFKKAGQIDPKQYSPFHNMGLAYTRMGKNNEAVTVFKQALEIKADDRDALHGLGLAYYKLGNYEEAAKTFKKATDLDPGDLVAWANLSYSLHSKGDEEGEVAALEEAIKHGGNSPRLAPIRRALAGYFYKKGDAESLKRANEEYTLSLKVAPNDPETLNGLALIALKQRKPDEAIKYLKQATGARPSFADAYNNLGVAYEAKSMREQAIASYKKALQIDPNNELARKNLDRYEKGSKSGKQGAL